MLRLALALSVLLVAPWAAAEAGWSASYSGQPAGVSCGLVEPGDCPRVHNSHAHFDLVAAGVLHLRIVDDVAPRVGGFAMAFDARGAMIAGASLCGAGEITLPIEAAEVVVAIDAAYTEQHCAGVPGYGTRGVVEAWLE